MNNEDYKKAMSEYSWIVYLHNITHMSMVGKAKATKFDLVIPRYKYERKE
jgi:hypothetical protein